MMTGDGRRPRRVAEQVREFLSNELLGGLGDPRLFGVVVTSVQVTADLGYADVYVRRWVGDEASHTSTLRALARASGHLRRGLAPRLKLKRVPDLRFHYDMGPDARARVDELLSEWKSEQGDD